MSNAATKTLTAALAALAMLGSCAGDRGEKEAAALVAEARAALEAGDCPAALTLADSVARAYPKALEARREALHTATLAREGMALREIEATDSLIAHLALRSDSLSAYVTKVDNPVEPYFVARGENTAAVYTTTGLHGRLSPEGDFYILATLAGHPVQSTSVGVEGPEGSSATTSSIPHDGERNDRSGSTEVITFLAAECDTVARYIHGHAGERLTLVFNGTKGTYRTPLSTESAERLAALYEYARTVREARMATVKREKLSRALELSRQQAARTFVEPTEK
ncbi:MAG: hypothetical protein K2K49_00710 [Duncaniella sp.]|nr:hypothetical protein [Duncaniella sp.]